MSKPTRTDNFTDEQRAEIYVRDRALCAYSGKSLWLADFGAAPSTIDWIDHFRSVARGGRATIENGVCASWLYNWIKREHGRAVLLFDSGFPTSDFFTYYESLPAGIAEHLRRFAQLDPSDWFYNRGLAHVIWGAAGLGERRVNGEAFVRGTEYYAKGAIKCFAKWRDRAEGVPSQRSRGLRPKAPSYDQLLLMKSSEAQSPLQIEKIMREFALYHRASWEALEGLSMLQSKADAKEYRKAILAHKYVVPRVKKAVRQNLALLSQILLDA